jgi:hypothetical protein
MKLLGGGYHFVAVGTESMMGQAAIGISQMANGDIAKGLATLMKSPANPYMGYSLGKKVQAEYLDPGKNPEMTPIVSALRDANFSMTPQQLLAKNPELQTVNPHSAANNYFTAFDRGRLKLDTEEAIQRVRQAADKNMATVPIQAGKEMFNVLGKTMQTVMYPLFNHYIPMLKNGVAFQQVSAFRDAWLQAHPGASEVPHDILTGAARQAADHVDNMLGMMNQSNIFWNKTLKQAVQGAMLSWSWNYGTARGIGGGLGKIARSPASVSIGSPNWDPRSSYVIAMPLVTITMAAIYQFLKTGNIPSEPPDNLGNAFTGQTGGKVPHGSEAERAILPGYQKDILGVWNNVINPKGTGKPITEIYNKLAPLLQLGAETVTNQNWAGHPIWNPQDPYSKQLQDYFHHVGQSLMPISADQATNVRQGSNISVPERVMGVRPAPTWIEKPAATQKAKAARDTKAWNEGQKFNKWMGQ